jgi:hypothetical protein
MEYKAINILRAARLAFESATTDLEPYVVSKSNEFMNRCGATLEAGPDQLIDSESVQHVVFAMLDADTEQVFWRALR